MPSPRPENLSVKPNESVAAYGRTGISACGHSAIVLVVVVVLVLDLRGLVASDHVLDGSRDRAWPDATYGTYRTNKSRSHQSYKSYAGPRYYAPPA